MGRRLVGGHFPPCQRVEGGSEMTMEKRASGQVAASGDRPQGPSPTTGPEGVKPPPRPTCHVWSLLQASVTTLYFGPLSMSAALRNQDEPFCSVCLLITRTTV